MAASRYLSDTITPVTNTNLKSSDKVYIAKSGDTIAFSCEISDFLSFLAKHVYALDENYQ